MLFFCPSSAEYLFNFDETQAAKQLLTPRYSSWQQNNELNHAASTVSTKPNQHNNWQLATHNSSLTQKNQLTTFQQAQNQLSEAKVSKLGLEQLIETRKRTRTVSVDIEGENFEVAAFISEEPATNELRFR